jgi:predicted ATP-dependent endonuclease of OLD family
MEMKRFRVQNYKKVNDTGWVECGRLTAFVGKNEAGKSAVFRGLSKLNPSDNQSYEPLKEFPRRRYTSEFKNQDWLVSSVVFALTKGEQEELTRICPLLEKATEAECNRFYSNSVRITFKPEIKMPNVSSSALVGLLKDWTKTLENLTAPADKSTQLGQMKTALLPVLTAKSQQLSSQSPITKIQEAQLNEISNPVMAQANEQWQKDLLNPIIEGINQFRKDLQSQTQLEQAKQWVISHMPKLIYFDNYDVIDSAVHVPNFITQLNQNPTAPRVRATKCLFEHVGLDLKAIQALDPNQLNKTEQDLRRMADERSILMSSASNAMTEKFSNWWEQRRHKFRYAVDGPFFRVWVSDDLDPSEIELDQRSLGLQYFFSFYLVFLVEAQGAYRNSILLLDEPGIHVHGTAQQKIVEFLRNLSNDNQVLYTTHSPFMVDGNHLEDVRVVYEDKGDGTTKISSDIWPDDKDSLFPLQAALGYSIAQTLFYSPKQFIVEGITDYWMLRGINSLLGKRGMKTLKEDVVIVPAGGVNSLMPLISLLLGHTKKLAILLDGDEPGLRKGKEVKSRLLLDCLFVSSFGAGKEAEIEDLFPEDYYMSAVKQAYPDVNISFTEEEKQISCISKRMQAVFGRIGRDSFEKWKPARVILDWIEMDSKSNHQVPPETLKKFESIFEAANKILL